MKQPYLSFVIFIATAVAPLFGQSTARDFNPSMDSSIVWDLGMSYSTIEGRPARLFSGQFRAFATEKWSLGLHFSLFQRQTKRDYDREIKEPQLSYGEAGAVTAYNLVQGKRFWLTPMLTLGYAAAVVSDRAVKEDQTVVYGNDDFFFVSQQEVPKEIVRNNYFLAKPELMATFRINRYLGLELGGGYNFLFGNSRIGNRSDFSNWVARGGLIVVLPTDE